MRDVANEIFRLVEGGTPGLSLGEVLAQMSDGIAIFDRERRLIAWNEKFADFAGVDGALLNKGQSFRDIAVAQAKAGEFGPCDPEAEAERRVRDHWRTEAVVVEREKPDGRVIELRRNPFSGGFVTVYIDVTEKKRAEKAAAEQRRLLANVLANTRQGVWFVDLTGRTTDLNPAMGFILDRPRDEILGRSILDFVDPENAEIFRRQLALRKQGITDPYEIALLRPDGTSVSCINTPVSMVDEAGKPIGSVGLWTDVSELKRVERELKELNATLEARVAERTAALDQARANLLDAVEGMRHSLILYDADDAIVLSNADAFGDLNPVADLVVPGTRFEDLVRGAIARGAYRFESDAEAKDFLAKRIETHRRADGQPHIRRLHGGRTVEVRETRTRSGGIVAIGHDITDRLRLEQQLLEAQKLESIGKLTGGLSHDLNNYLGIVLGNLDFLREVTADRPDARDLVAAAERGASKAVELNRSLLAFARRQPLAPEIVDVAQSVRETLVLLASSFGPSIDVDFASDAELWPALVDRAQLGSSIVNLGNNAKDAMPRGGKLEVRIRNTRRPAGGEAADAGEFVLIEMRDNGQGMSGEVLAQVFEPFFTTKPRGQGTGLGLSMVYGFVKQSNGHIEIDSKPGHGTALRLFLPRAVPLGAAKAVKEVASTEMPTGTEYILVVEDNAGLRETVIKQLDSLGYRTSAAANAAEALKIVENVGPALDLVFTDIVMPGELDGVELAARVLARWPALKVQLTTGFPGTDEGGEIKATEAYPVLRKPYTKSELARAIRTALDG